MAKKIPTELYRTTLIYGVLWIIFGGLLLIHYLNLLPNFFNMLGVWLFVAMFFILPITTLLFLLEWVKFFLTWVIPKKYVIHFGFVILLLLFYISILLIGQWFFVDEEQIQVQYFANIMVLFLLIIVGLWLLVWGLSIVISQVVAMVWYRLTKKPLNQWGEQLIYMLVFVSVYWSIRYLVEDIPLVEWLFNKM